MAMTSGTIVGGYRIVRVLGAGGMGTVYLAKHPSLPRMDALKVLSSELSRDSEFRARFEREANLAAGLDHPNIVSVYNRGEEDGQLWIAMQYVDGTDASAEVSRNAQSMTPLRALRITEEVGKGLDYAHRKGLLHRDIKPANFLLSSNDGGEEDERVFLTDFGVAKSADDPGGLTQTGSFLATIAYAPPEQLSGQSLDHRADIYSLACSFFKLLTGQNPYPAAQPALVMMGHLHEPPPSAVASNPGLPSAIDHVFAKAMAKNPAERYNTCREFVAAAREALTPGHNPIRTYTSPTYPIQLVPPPPPENLGTTDTSGPSPHTSSNRRRLYIGGAIGLVVAVAVGVSVWSSTGGASNSGPEAAPPHASTSMPTVSQPRISNPNFAGKTITIVDYVGGQGFEYLLSGTPQTEFLEDLGFVYNLTLTREDGGPPRGSTTHRFSDKAGGSDAYVLVFRSDAAAGAGGIAGLPFELMNSRAQLIAIDDPATVSAMRNWSDRSEQVFLDKLVPILSKRIK